MAEFAVTLGMSIEMDDHSHIDATLEFIDLVTSAVETGAIRELDYIVQEVTPKRDAPAHIVNIAALLDDEEVDE